MSNTNIEAKITRSLQNYVINHESKTLYVDPTEILPGDLLVIENTTKKPKQSAKKKPVLLFSLSSSGSILTKAGKEYLVKNNLWSSFQLKLAEQNNTKHKVDHRNNLLSSYNKQKKPKRLK